MSHKGRSDSLTPVLGAFDVRQARCGGYVTQIMDGDLESCVAERLLYQWSFVEPAASLADETSIYSREVELRSQGKTCCLSLVSADPA